LNKLGSKAIIEDFPILNQKVYNKRLVYLDNAATSQKPLTVLDAIQKYYREYNSNVHRGIHKLSELATYQFEQARENIAKFINAKNNYEIVFVRGTTEGINLVAHSFGQLKIKPGDEILITEMEHHSNIVPWQLICEQRGASLRILPINDNGELLIDKFSKLANEKTKLFALTHVSNALGTINPVVTLIGLAHQLQIPVLIDGAQAVSHFSVDVQELDCDFYVFSGHKLYAPTGIGVLYGKEKFLEAMPPYQGGGDMISKVTFEKTTYNCLPYKFEAGTPNIEGVIGLNAAIEYLKKIGMGSVYKYELELYHYATEKLKQFPNLRLIGTAHEKAAVISFCLGMIHPHDIGTILDREGIAIRTGHHCAQPVMDHFGIAATARASFALYNTKEEIDLLCMGLKKVHEVFK
jgi:cysteine desulfurase/selenocysteine lyase